MQNNGLLAPSVADPDGRAAPIVERNRYFTGKYMTARDFQADPDYFLSRHRLHNWLLHGWGVVYGLHITRHPDPECDHRWVIVEAGIAIDCFGRELILEERKPVDLCAVWRLRNGALVPPDNCADPPQGPFLICAYYLEKPIDYVPALYSDDNCDPRHKEANRVRETAAIVVVPLQDVGEQCWPNRPDPKANCKSYLKDDCDKPFLGPPGVGPDGECPCHGFVPLALVESVQCTDPATLPTIVMRGRRTVAVAPDNLTRIVGVNWPHGGAISLSRLRDPIAMGGALEIYFDRKLLIPEPNEGSARGVNLRTFSVQYGGVQRALEFLDGTVSLDNEAAKATFRIKSDFLAQPQNIAYNTVYVTLKCDFIYDCHGQPVDGNFLGGHFPTGNGTPGGTFESWFEVAPDNIYDQGRV